MKNLLISLFLCSLASVSFAEGSSHHNDGREHHDHEKEHHDHEEEHTEHEAHLHGFAELEVALEGGQMEIAFESPAVNIVGFEHRTESNEQRAQVQSAKSKLETPAQLFSFFGVSCSVRNVEVDVSALMPVEHDSHDTEHDHDHEQTHSEISAHYRFECEDNSSQMSALEVRLFSQFPGLEKLNVMWVTDTRQGAAELTSGSSVVRFR